MSKELDLAVFPHGQQPGALELYELFLRRQLTLKGGKVNALSRQTVEKVNANAQAESMERLLPVLTEEEQAIVRRAQNTHQTPPKHTDKLKYQKATGLEAVLGYLYLTGQTDRLNELLRLAADMEGTL